MRAQADLNDEGISAERGKKIILAYSQSNFAKIGNNFPWCPPSNARLWDGGVRGLDGTAFRALSADSISVPAAAVASLAEKNPEIDYHLVICATGGTGVRAAVGMDYLWHGCAAEGPEAGGVQISDAADRIFYSPRDKEGWLRFRGATSLGMPLKRIRPARLEVADDPSRTIVFEVTGPREQSGTWFSQEISVVSSTAWPPPDGTVVRLYPAQDWLRRVIRGNAETAFDALGRVGGQRVFDEIWIWPTESDVSYHDSYEGRDHPELLRLLSPWTGEHTQFTYTLPWPHHPVAQVHKTLAKWWDALRRIVAEKPEQRALVSFDDTPVEYWCDSNNVHVAGGMPQWRLGSLMAERSRKT